MPDGFWQMLLTRLSLPGARLFATPNPDVPGHWQLKKLDRAGELDLAVSHFGLDDNPALDPAYVEQLKAENAGLSYKRFVVVLWVQAEGAINETFGPELHVADLLPAMARWLCTEVDYGAVNPSPDSCSGSAGTAGLYVVREYRLESRKACREKTDADYSTDLRAALEGWQQDPGPTRPVDPTWLVVDPSAPSFMMQLHRDAGPAPPGRRTTRWTASGPSPPRSRGRVRMHRSCDRFPATCGIRTTPSRARTGRPRRPTTRWMPCGSGQWRRSPVAHHPTPGGGMRTTDAAA